MTRRSHTQRSEHKSVSTVSNEILGLITKYEYDVISVENEAILLMVLVKRRIQNSRRTAGVYMGDFGTTSTLGRAYFCVYVCKKVIVF